MEEKIKELIEKLNYHTMLYDLGQSEISDIEWDRMYFELQELEEKSGIRLSNSPTQRINYKVVNELEKVKHNHPMLSLAKTKDWSEFIQYFEPGKDVILMPKLDGLTCSLRYINGSLVSAETRGNGVEGENILHNAKVISSIPNTIDYKDELIVDGEIICKTKNFEKFSNTYKNARNFASGSIRLLDSKECSKRDLTFVAWYVVKGFEDEKYLSSKLTLLDKNGFETANWVTSFDYDAKEFTRDEAIRLGYPIDGLVARYEDVSFGETLGATGHHRKDGYAFKFADDEYETELIDIEWTMGRTGQITPVAVFTPVDDGESIIERASLHNISIMRELLGKYPEKNQKIIVYKANQIIPQVLKAFKKNDIKHDNIIENNGINMVCPICHSKTEIRNNNDVMTLWCTNLDCEGQLLNKIDHYCGKKGLDIKGLSKATIEKLIDWEWLTAIQDLYKLKYYRNTWINKSGFGEKSVDNILNAIEESKSCELHSFISAIGIPLIGSTYAKTLSKLKINWNNIREDINNNFDFASIDGFGYEMDNSLKSYDYDEADYIAYRYLNISNSLYNKNNSNKLKDQKIAITGKVTMFKNRQELQDAIEENGGKVVSSVTKNTTILINNDNTSSSSKNLSAQKLGIPVLTEQDFFDKYLKN